MTAPVLVICGFAVVMVLIAWHYRVHPSSDEYFIAGRRAAPVTVGAALFQLIGGGEIVTITALAWSHGFAAISLFLGYAGAFFALGFFAQKIRARAELAKYYSLPDYVYDVHGPRAGRIVAGISILAFFALMLLQFSSAGHLLAPLVGLRYESAVIMMALIPLTYLIIGGFKTVLVTDLLQGGVMLAIMLILAGVLGVQYGFVGAAAGTSPLPLFSCASMVLTGFFVAVASSDVWQRALAAKTNHAARIGFFQGGFWLLIGGLVLSWMGVLAKYLGVSDNADSAFSLLMSKLLPPPLQALVALLMFVALISTADTEMFLLSSLLQREYSRLRHGGESLNCDDVSRGRALLFVIAVLGAIIALVWRELIEVYTWLLSTLLVASPLVAASLFGRVGPKSAAWCLALNGVLFVTLWGVGVLNLENAFLIVLPGTAVLLFGHFLETKANVEEGSR
jgi:solute:Na+ symporter, SSS family